MGAAVISEPADQASDTLLNNRQTTLQQIPIFMVAPAE
jgi:hypothetical protein